MILWQNFISAFEFGLIYALVAIGVYISFRIIDFPDLTVEGSFVLGAATTSAMITYGYNPYLSIIISIIAGLGAGTLTGYLHVRWHILGLLSSILTMTMLYSLNIRIMHKPNLAIFSYNTIFTDHSVLSILTCFLIIIIISLKYFFASNFGLAIRSIGINPALSKAYGINVNHMKVFTLALSNAIVALAGALFAQSQGFTDISMSTGTIIAGLASIIIGETLLKPKTILTAFFACACGSIIYRSVIIFALNLHNLGLQPSDLNMITALLVTLVMIVPKLRNKQSNL